METFDIAKLKVQFDAKGELLQKRSRPYLTEDTDKPDMILKFPAGYFEHKKELFPHLTLDECYYMWTGEAFYARLLKLHGMLLHASCIEKDGYAYLFSAKSGTGKSTHTSLWLKEFPGTRLINDDKPAVRKIDGRFLACGTPFSGKFDLSVNVQVPIRALVFLERGKENAIRKITPTQAIPLFMSQTLRPPSAEGMTGMLDILSEILTEIPVFLLTCNMEPSAAHVSYDGIEAFYQNLGDSYEN